jgi:Pyruvate/2-oxoacid:ferredoxin oxidoreductase delta subunit
MIALDREKCIGCATCSNVCPSKLITRTDSNGKRTIRYSKCSEFCDICVEFCPGKALSIVEIGEDIENSFDLVPCRVCGTPYATEPMLKRVESTVPVHLQADASGVSGVWICPACRRLMEGERASKQVVLGRR